jgi:hypothetical protein
MHGVTPAAGKIYRDGFLAVHLMGCGLAHSAFADVRSALLAASRLAIEAMHFNQRSELLIESSSLISMVKPLWKRPETFLRRAAVNRL